MRRRSKQDEPVEPEGTESADPADGSVDDRVDGRANGPWDASEVELDEDAGTHVILGSLAVTGRPGVEVRLQADQASGQVQSVMLVAEDGAMELRPFAAPRHESIWDDIRERLASEATRRGGRAEEVAGPFGTALQMVLPAVAPDGTKGTQTSTVHGVVGPRWLLRVTTFGRPAVEYQEDGLLEQVLREVVVVRGTEPRSPGEALPLVLPPSARQMPPQAQEPPPS
jgi:hypothetical protein